MQGVILHNSIQVIWGLCRPQIAHVLTVLMQLPTEDNTACESCLHYITQDIGQSHRSAFPVSLADVIHAKLVKSCGLSGKRFLQQLSLVYITL